MRLRLTKVIREDTKHVCLERDTVVSPGDPARQSRGEITGRPTMMEHKQAVLLAPSLSNSSCWRGGTSEAAWTGPGPGELIRAILILLLSLGILCANLLVICVINSRRYSKYIHAQVSRSRYELEIYPNC